MSTRPSASAPVFSPRRPGPAPGPPGPHTLNASSAYAATPGTNSPSSGTPLSGHAQAFQPPPGAAAAARLGPALSGLSLNDASAPASPGASTLSARAAKAAVFVPRSVASTPAQSSPVATEPPNPLPPASLSNVLRAAPFHPQSRPTSRPSTPARTLPSNGASGGVYLSHDDAWPPPEYADPLNGASPAGPMAMPAFAPQYNNSVQANAASHAAALTTAAGRMGLPPTLAQQQPTLALQYQLYAPAGPPPRLPANASAASSDTAASIAASDVFFLPSNLNEQLRRRQEATWTGPIPPALRGPQLPEFVHKYHSLCPLERLPPPAGSPQVAHMGAAAAAAAAAAATGLPSALAPPDFAPHAPVPVGGQPSRTFRGFPSTVYKALSQEDGRTYCLTRIANFRLAPDSDLVAVQRWRNALNNPRRPPLPGVVGVYEAFTTRAFGDSSLIFVTEYHACSVTLAQAHLSAKPAAQPDAYRPYAQAAYARQGYARQPAPTARLSEATLWIYLVQMATALRTVHAAGLAVRSITPHKVLVTEPGKVRFSGASVLDVLDPLPEGALPAPGVGADEPTEVQADDLTDLAKLILALAAGSDEAVQTPSDWPAALAMLRGAYSAELESVVRWLLEGEGRSASALIVRLAPHLADTLNVAMGTTDVLQSGLQKEVENGRLVRLLCKLGFINERGELEQDPRWSETGERYLIKLFRDAVFHASTDAGTPLVDLSYILVNLNKLDAGSEERLLLTSRDEQTCIVVSYHEIKQAIESAFQELCHQ